MPKPVEELATKLIDSNELWESGLEGDGYRYVGSGTYNSATAPSNFICFGTSDKTECKNNESKYMYRIIGVFSYNSGNQHVKLISFKKLIGGNWNDANSDVDWESSTLFATLNGNGFLTNTTYDYLQSSVWLNKIENWTWSAVNTKTYESSGPNYYSVTTEQIYLHQMNRSSKSSSIGEWTTPNAKIGLMYASDYQMSLGSSSLNYTGQTDAATLKTGWIHSSNNDMTVNKTEWTISRYGLMVYDDRPKFCSFAVYSDGSINYNFMDYAYGGRPVFYLTSAATYNSGSGT